MSTLSVKFNNLRRRLTPERDMSCTDPTNKNQKIEDISINAEITQANSAIHYQDSLNSQKVQNDLEYQEYLSRRFDAQQLAKSQQQNFSSSHLHYHPVRHDFTNHLNPAYTQPTIPSTLAYTAYNVPASISTSSQFDRLASSVGHMSLVNPYHHHHHLQSSSSSILGHTTYSSAADIRDNEIERLKMRIMMLEQSTPDSNYSTKITEGTLNGMQKLTKIEQVAANLRNEMGNEMRAKEEKLASLEQLLNKQEYEAAESRNVYRKELEQTTNQLVNTKKELADVEIRLLEEREKSLTAQRLADRLQSQLNDRDEYIGKLPTIDEVAQNKKQMDQANEEKETLKSKIKELEKKIHRAKELIKENNTKAKQSEERVAQIELAREKLEIEFTNYKQQTQNVGLLMEQCQENASIRAEFELAKKMILRGDERLKTEISRYEKELEKIRDERRLELDSVQAFRGELNSKEKEIHELETSIKSLNTQNQTFQHELLGLQEKLESYELLGSGETAGLLHALFAEMSGCTRDLDVLVKNCCDLYEQKQVDMVSLLGIGGSDYSKSDLGLEKAAGLINREYLMRRTKEVRKLRELLSNIRKKVSDLYADNIAMNMSCATQ